MQLRHLRFTDIECQVCSTPRTGALAQLFARSVCLRSADVTAVQLKCRAVFQPGGVVVGGVGAFVSVMVLAQVGDRGAFRDVFDEDVVSRMKSAGFILELMLVF